MALTDRQYIFVDDFQSMAAEKRKVERTARVISYFIKDADPNQMELYFASDVSRPLYCENSSDVESSIAGREFVKGRCNMSSCLSSFVDMIIEGFGRRDRKRVSVYVLTDAIWEPGEDPEVDKVIKRVVREMKRRDLSRESVMFQFIRFGDVDNARAKERLRSLDDDIVKDRKGDYL